MSKAPSQRLHSAWFWMDSGPCDGATNMAVDQALLESATRLSAPILRFYSWNEPCASLGYFQCYNEISQLTAIRPLVRRPTGGGLVHHGHDWTYSVVFPPNHSWYTLTARESYHNIHEWLRKSLELSGLTTELCPSRKPNDSGLCFSGAEVSDLLRNGHKVAGAAQRRNKMGLLIQGSLAPSEGWPRRVRWQQSMCDVMARDKGVNWTFWAEDPSLTRLVRDLSEQKFSSELFTRKR